jgi:hypothetical protein
MKTAAQKTLRLRPIASYGVDKPGDGNARNVTRLSRKENTWYDTFDRIQRRGHFRVTFAPRAMDASRLSLTQRVFFFFFFFERLLTSDNVRDSLIRHARTHSRGEGSVALMAEPLVPLAPGMSC